MARSALASALLLCAGCAGSGAGDAAPSVLLYTVDLPEGAEPSQILRIERSGAAPVERADAGHLYAMRPAAAGTVLGLVSEDGLPPQRIVELDAAGAERFRLDWEPLRAGITHMRAPHGTAGGRILVAGYAGEPDADGRFPDTIALEIGRDGREIRRVSLGPAAFLGAVRPLGPDRLLVAGEGVAEIGWDGSRREILPSERHCRDAVRLADGGLLIGEVSGKVTRLDADGRERWSAPHALPVSLQLLPDGGVLAAG